MNISQRIKKDIAQFIRFGVVGSIGFGINFCVYFGSSELLQLNYNYCAILAFSVAVGNNYVLNHLWTFRVKNCFSSLNFRQFFYYILVNIQGLTINLVTLNLIVIFAGIKYHLLGQAFGIFIGMFSNFIFAKKIVFKI
jgi:putative flippase GtrA